jgi:hypothetical protein
MIEIRLNLPATSLVVNPSPVGIKDYFSGLGSTATRCCACFPSEGRMGFSVDGANLLGSGGTKQNRSKSDFGIHNECVFVSCREEM